MNAFNVMTFHLFIAYIINHAGEYYVILKKKSLFDVVLYEMGVAVNNVVVELGHY